MDKTYEATTMTDIGDAIRYRLETDTEYSADDMADAILSIPEVEATEMLDVLENGNYRVHQYGILNVFVPAKTSSYLINDEGDRYYVEINWPSSDFSPSFSVYKIPKRWVGSEADYDALHNYENDIAYFVYADND